MVNVLIVEDDEDQATLLCQAATSQAWHCEVAASVEAGLELASSKRPDLIITDIQLPGETGFDMCRKIRASAELKGTPIIMITGTYNKQEDRLRAENMGADAYLLKPFHIDELLQIARRLLNRKI